MKLLAKRVVVGAVVATSALAAAGAQAGPTTFPGGNGTILAGNDNNLKLYLVSVDGRRRREIPGVRTALAGDAGQAAWSPDGTRIAFARRGGGISITDPTGRVVRVTKQGDSPAWSPDGTRIVFERAEWLYLVRADGRGLRRLFPGWDAQWSPDGMSITFVASEANDIVIAALDGSARVRVATASSGDCGHGPGSGGSDYDNPAWAPDGSRIAFVERQFCWSSNADSIEASAPDGTNRTTLVWPTGEGDVSAPVWSPDGRAIAYYTDDGVAWSGLSVLHLQGRNRAVARNLRLFDWRPVCELRGRPRGDRLRGSSRSELVCGLGGNDTITGGAGRDRLFGEEGNDRFLARDGDFDVVGCGPGRDTVDADLADLVGVDCERVVRQ